MKMVDMGEIKMVNAIMYFAKKNVKFLYKTKTFKLLYFLDFLHIEKVGIPVTNQEYLAYPKGPVPEYLVKRIDENNLSDYFNERIEIVKRKFGVHTAYEFVPRPKQKINMDVFSPIQIELLDRITFFFKDLKAEEISEITHLPNSPWAKTISEKGLRADIDFLLAINEDSEISTEIARERLKLEEDIRESFGNVG